VRSRLLVTGIFLLLTVATGIGSVDAVAAAASLGSLHGWAIALYAVLKLAIVLAFSLFVFTRDPARRPSRDPVAFAACAAAVGAVVLLRHPGPSADTGLVLAGELIAVTACAWLLVSVLALGRCFGVLPEVRGLVTDGPYRFVRHPVYLGELGACAGLLVAAPSLWNAGVAAVFLGAQAIRMRLEELALAEEFPEYAAYAAATPRMVPLPSLRARLGPVAIGGRGR
jgi:protein-S-isoprenylcysteine O-methyltransferase Ste14